MSDPAQTPLIRLRGVTRVYGEGSAEVQALRGVDLDIAAGQAHRGQRRTRGLVARGRRLATVQQRQFHVLLRAGARQQVEALEDEAQMRAPQQRALVAVEPVHRHATEQVGAGAG